MDNSEILDRIMDRIEQAKSFTKGWHENIVLWRNLYNFKHYTKKPKPGETQFADPTYTNAVDLAVGIFQGNALIWEATGWSPSQQELKDSSAIERYLSSLLEINSDRGEYDILYEIYLNFVRDGGAVLRTVWDKNLGKKSKTGDLYTESPILVDVVDPLSVHLLSGGPNRWAVIVQETIRSVADVEDEYGIVFKKWQHLTRAQKAATMDTFYDYWTWGRKTDLKPTPDQIETDDGKAIYAISDAEDLVVMNAVIYADQFVYPLREMPGYNNLAYVVSFYKPTDRSDSGSWQSMISPMISTVQQLERAINRRQRQIDVYSSMPLIVKSRQGRQITLDPGIGNAQQMQTDEDMGFPSWPGNPPDVESQINLFRSKIQQSGFSDIMYGSGVGSVTGYALSQLGDQNRIRLEQPITHLERLLTWWSKRAIDLTLEFGSGSKIAVYGTNKEQRFADFIDVDRLAGFSVACRIRPEFPNEEVRKHAMATQAMGNLSKRTLLQRYYNIQQPDIEIEQKLQEEAMQHPVYQTYALLKTLQEAAKEGDEIAQMTIQQIQQNGVPGQTGRPKEPNNPEQMMGVQTPTGGATPTARGQSEVGAFEQMSSASPDMMGGVM